MKKLLTILLFFLTLSVSGQIMPGVVASQGGAAASAYTAEYQAVLNAMTTDPTGDTLTWQDDLIYSLDSAGYWDRMDILYVFAQRNSQGALLNWKAPAGDDNATDQNTTAFVVYEGFKGNGTDDWLSTNYNPTSEGSNFTQNSATLAVYSRSSGTNGSGNLVGAYDGNFTTLSLSSGPTTDTRLNSGSTNVSSSGTDYRTGFLVATRRAADDVEVYKNTTSIATGTVASTGLINYNLAVFARNQAPSAGTFSDSQISVVIIMDGITDADEAKLYAIIQHYMYHIGKSI